MWIRRILGSGSGTPGSRLKNGASEGGFYTNPAGEAPSGARRVHEILPVRGRAGDVLGSRRCRSLEIWKEPGESDIRIIATASEDDGSFPGELGHDSERIGQGAPDWVGGAGDELVGFDAELARQYNFAPLEGEAPHLLNSLAATVSENRGAGMWVQLAYEDLTDRIAPIAAETCAKIAEAADGDGPEAETAAKLHARYASRAGGALIGLSIRGALLSASASEDAASLEAVLGGVRIARDRLGVSAYPAHVMLPWLESRRLCSEAAIGALRDNAKMWKDPRWGAGRRLVPFLIVTPRELCGLVRVPDDPSLGVKYLRRRSGGAAQTRAGFDLETRDYGLIGESAAAIAPSSLLMHTYVVGATGCGKSSALRSILKHLEMANERRTFRSASVVIDIKDEDARLCVRQCDEGTVGDGRVSYIDINEEGFALNLLELPPYAPGGREIAVSRTVGHVVSLLKDVYSQRQTYVQVERVLRLLLLYLYANTDTPTLSDMYSLIIQIQSGSEAAVRRIKCAYGSAKNPELDAALGALAKMPRDAWTPLINRIEPFVIEGYLRERFAVKRSTVDFEAMLEPGRTTVFRIAEAQTPAHAHRLAAMIVAIRVWSAVLARYEQKRPLTPVILFLDEFHAICEMETLLTMLSRGRSLGLGLVLAHQNLGQIPDRTLDAIVGNTAVQLYGRVSGDNAARIARIIDPGNAAVLAEQISAQPDYAFTHTALPGPGQERAAPSSVRAAPPPELLWPEIPGRARPAPAPRPDGGSIEAALISDPNRWRMQLCVPLRTQTEWRVLVALRAGDMYLRALALEIGAKNRDAVRAAIDSLAGEGLVGPGEAPAPRDKRIAVYALTPAGRATYFPSSWDAIGTARDVAAVAAEAFEHYVSRGMFVSVASQGGPGDKVDMIAYDYAAGLATSVEIESVSEVASHPEHVVYNMTKWPEMGFAFCDVWSKAPRIVELGKRVPARTAERLTCRLAGAEDPAGGNGRKARPD